MMADSDSNALVSMADQFTGLPMQALIGGPLNAAAEANAMMAMTQTKFILDTAFAREKSGEAGKPDVYKPVMIKMTLLRGLLDAGDPDATPPVDPSFKEFETTFDLPLLTIIPLNSLAVDDVKISFDMEVKSSFADSKSAKTEEKLSTQSSFEAKIGYGCFSATIKGSASYDRQNSNSEEQHYEKSNAAKYSVSVHAGQLPLPEGVKTIITAFSSSISPITMPRPAPKANS
jgi:uncharacterized protein DUF2589